MKNTRDDLSAEDKAIIQEQITSALRYLYGDTASEPLPDKVLALLEELVTREVRHQRNLSEPHNDNEANDAF